MNEELQELFKQYIRDNLRLDVRTDSVYNGGYQGSSMYTDYHSVQLILDNEIISEVSL
jgi:hypothetical protein